MTGADPLDMAAVAVDDALLDALGAGAAPDDDPLTQMLAAWRDTARAGTPDLPPRPAHPTSREECPRAARAACRQRPNGPQSTGDKVRDQQGSNFGHVQPSITGSKRHGHHL